MKQISFVVWLDVDDETISRLENGWKQIVKAIDSNAKVNVYKKEKGLNKPRVEKDEKIEKEEKKKI